jgi:8-oxo-dGTP diphosphatase
VVREDQEETGVIVEVERLTGVYKNMTRGIVALVYRCRPRSGVPGASQESTAVQWVSPADIPQLMTPAYAVRVLDALTDQPASRSHDGVAVLGQDTPARPARTPPVTPAPAN